MNKISEVPYNRKYSYPVFQEGMPAVVTVCASWIAHEMLTEFSISSHRARIVIPVSDYELPFLDIEKLYREFVELFLYLYQRDQRIYLSWNIAKQTIRYLKETN